MTVKGIRTLTGLSQARFAEKYGIPKRTLEKWEQGETNPPAYLVKLLERAVKDDYKEVKRDETIDGV